MADRCDPIRHEIGALQAEIAGLQGDLADASTQQKAGIASAIKALRSQVTSKKAALAKCEQTPGPAPAPPPPAPTPAPPPPPPPVDKCAPIRREVGELKAEIAGLQGDLNGASTPQKPAIVSAIAAARSRLLKRQAALSACVGLPPRIDPAGVPMSVSLVRLHCTDQEDTEPPIFDTEDDEPYVIVMAVNGQGRFVGVGGIGFQLTESRVFRVGPLASVDQGETRTPPANLLWGLADQRAPIARIDKVAFLVAMLEHDRAKVTAVENRIVTAAQAGLAGLMLAAEGRTDLDIDGRFELLVQTALQAFDGAVSIARLDALDPDDQIGPAQVLRFTDADQQRLLRGEVPAIERSLNFSGDDARYGLTFALRR
jgi:hypothetical protein